MSHDVSPILDRHTQERLGCKLREELDDARVEAPSKEIEALLASLRAASDQRGDRRPDRN